MPLIAQHSECLQGFKRGRQETLQSMEQEIAKAARVAYANESLADEKRRVGELAKEIDTLRKTQIRSVAPTGCSADIGVVHRVVKCSPPIRDTECKQEEAAYLACTPDSSNRQCAEVIRQYKACADTIVAKLVNPRSQRLQ
jgi:hypothetical protein